MKAHRVKQGFTLIELLVVIAIIAILAAILFPVFSRAREKAYQTTCLSNQKQIALANMMYTQENKEKMPKVDANVFDTIKISGKMLECPTAERGAQGYVFNAVLSSVSLGALANPETVWITADAATTMIDPVATNADEIGARHDGGFIASFADGHAEYFNNKRKMVRYEVGGGLTQLSALGGSFSGTTLTPTAANKLASATVRPNTLPTWKTTATKMETLISGASYGLLLRNIGSTGFTGDIEIMATFQIWDGTKAIDAVGTTYYKTISVTAGKSIEETYVYPLYNVASRKALKELDQFANGGTASGNIRLIPAVTISYVPTATTQKISLGGIDFVIFGDESYGEEE